MLGPTMTRKSGALGLGLLGLALGFTACGGGATPGKPAKGAERGGGSAESESADGSSATRAVEGATAGDKALEKRSASLTFDLTLKKGDAAGGMQAGSWSLEEERSLQVLAADGGKVTKLEIAFGKRESKPLLGVELTTATAGHTYVIESKGEAPSVSRADGKPITGAERDALMTEYDWVGGPTPLAKWLGPATSGKTLTGGPAEARALLGVLAGVDYTNSKVSATPKGKGGGSIELDVTATLRLTGGQTFFDFELKGTAKVDAKTGLVSELSLEGPVRASGKLEHKKGMLDVTGTGKASLSRSASR